MQRKNDRPHLKRKLQLLLMISLVMIGLALLFYPSVSSWYNDQFQIRAVVTYDENVNKLSKEHMDEQMAEAHQYNETLTNYGITDPFIPGGNTELSKTYTSILNVNNGIMGSIEIPKINVNLPIYHGTSARVLEKGVGHMEMTAFPIGGEGGHSVLTGHTALPNATLFTNLDKLVEGDVFYIKVYKEIFAYQVDQITVVKPDNTKPLMPQSGQDYVSLVTCTPYAVNSHRLLVRGVRIPYEPEEYAEQVDNALPISIPYELIIALIVAAGLIILILVQFWFNHRKNRHDLKSKG